MDDIESTPRDVRLADAEASAQPLQSFIAATTVALAEMAGIEVVVREVCRAVPDRPRGDISVLLRLHSATEGTLVLDFPERTAWAIAERVLADVHEERNESLVRDCVGEIANVIAGQAKTLLAGTPYQMTFSLPQVVVGDSSMTRTEPGGACLAVAFCSDVGEFTMRLASAPQRK